MVGSNNKHMAISKHLCLSSLAPNRQSETWNMVAATSNQNLCCWIHFVNNFLYTKLCDSSKIEI